MLRRSAAAASPSRTLALATAALAPGLAALWALLRDAGGQRRLEFALTPGSLDGITAVSLAIFGALALLAVFVALRQLALPRLSTWTVAGAASLGLYTLLAWASEDWSLSPFQTRMETLHAATYLGAVLLGAMLVHVPRRPWLALAAVVGGFAAVEVAWAVIARSFHGTSQQFPRLAGPTDHANALAMAASALLLLGAAGLLDAGRRAQVAGGAAAATGALVLAATVSRSGAVCGLLGLLLLCVLADDRRLLRFSPVLFALPFLALGAWVSTWPELDAELHGGVRAAGIQLLGVAAGSALVGSSLAPLAARLPLRVESRLGERIAGVLLGTALVVGLVAFVVVEGGPGGAWDAFRGAFAGSGRGAGAARLTSISSDARSAYWSEAWDAFTREPWRGWGAGTFDQLNRIQGTPAHPSPVSSSAHSTPLQALAETGILGGLAMIAAGVALLAGALAQALRLRAHGARDRRLAAAVGCSCAVLFAHGLTDLDWDVTSQGVVVCVALGALGTRGLAVRSHLAWGGRLVAGACAILAVAVALAAIPPVLAADRAARALGVLQAPGSAADCRRASSLGRDARRFFPELASAWVAEGLADYQRREVAAGASAFGRALRIEPANYNVPRLQALGVQAAGLPNAQVSTLLARTYQLSGFRPEFKPPETLPEPAYLALCG